MQNLPYDVTFMIYSFLDIPDIVASLTTCKSMYANYDILNKLGKTYYTKFNFRQLKKINTKISTDIIIPSTIVANVYKESSNIRTYRNVVFKVPIRQTRTITDHAFIKCPTFDTIRQSFKIATFYGDIQYTEYNSYILQNSEILRLNNITALLCANAPCNQKTKTIYSHNSSMTLLDNGVVENIFGRGEQFVCNILQRYCVKNIHVNAKVVYISSVKNINKMHIQIHDVETVIIRGRFPNCKIISNQLKTLTIIGNVERLTVISNKKYDTVIIREYFI